MPSSSSSSGKATGNNINTNSRGGGPDLTALKNRQRNASSKGGGGGSNKNNRYWLYWASIVTAAALSVLLAQQQYSTNSNALVSQAEQLGEMSEEDVINLWKQNCARGAVTNVDRVPFSEMTVQRFHREYLLPRKAVVITNAYASSPLTTSHENDITSSHSSSSYTYRWSFSGIRQAYGHVLLKTRIPLRRGQNVNCTTSGLCKGPIMTLAKLFDETFLLDMSERIRRRRKQQQFDNTDVVAENMHVNAYPHDIDLQTTLPGVFDEYKKLSILTENLHLATRSGNLDRWPSLFLGPATTKTGLHVDNFGTSFSMAVFHGRKQFVLFDAVDGNQHLCLDQPGAGSNYGVDSFSPNFRACPMAKRAHPQFASLGPGDLLYVPGSTHHAARNMDDSIGIAQNFLTIADYFSVVESHKGKSAQSLRLLRNKPAMPEQEIDIPDSLLAQLDLFKILQETGYYKENYYYMDENSSSDDDDDSIINNKSILNNDPISFVSAPDSVRLATERVVKHLEKALVQEPLLATRIAFLSSNPYAVLSLKAAGVWNCLDDIHDIRHEKFISISPPAVPLNEVDNEVFNRIRQAVVAAAQQQHQTFECQTVMRQYVKALETNRQYALVALEKETGLE